MIAAAAPIPASICMISRPPFLAPALIRVKPGNW